MAYGRYTFEWCCKNVQVKIRALIISGLMWILPVLAAISAAIPNGICHLYPYLLHDPLKGTPAPVGSIWPQPSLQSIGQHCYAVDTNNFRIRLTDWNGDDLQCEVLSWAVGNYEKMIRNLKPANTSTAKGISVLEIAVEMCTSDSKYPDASMDDSISSLKVTTDDYQAYSVAKVNRPWGALRAMENFYQMLWPADDTFTVYNVNETDIQDSPRFPHRGILIDSARHYLPEHTIIEILTVMMYNKFNVLHWHLTDDQSFPYVSKKFPELSEQGAYHKKAIYTPESVQRIIDAAAVRGIRVMLEFDTPGHVGGFGYSHPEILTKCDPNRTKKKVATRQNLDPSNNATYEFMREFFSEVVENVTKDSYIHLGMDEVYFPCWESSQSIRDFMEANGLETMSELQGYYTQRHVDMIKSLNVTPVAWQDPLDVGTQLDPSVVVHVWKTPWNKALENAVRKGHKVLLSSCWYINLIDYGETWRRYYECDPLRGANLTGYEDQMLGGEAAIWGEYIDQTNIVPTLFPYASAVASVLWDTNRENGKDLSTDDAMWRLDDFRCKLLRRGVRAQPILNGYCSAFDVVVN